MSQTSSLGVGLLLLMTWPSNCLYSCKSNYSVPNPAVMQSKGLCLDDTTYGDCVSKIPGEWPHLQGTSVTSLRLFKPWTEEWGDDTVRLKSWAFLKDWCTANNCKILFGTNVTCDQANDDADWKLGLELLQLLGPKHILGLAVGNEVDVAAANIGSCNAAVDRTKLDELWNGRYFAQIKSRVADFDKNGFGHLPVTAVWSGSVLEGNPWKEDAEAKVNTLMTQVNQLYGDRWVYSFNIYAIWDSAQYPTDAANCKKSTIRSVSISYAQGMLTEYRRRIAATRGDGNGRIFVGEFGWSSPILTAIQHDFSFCPTYFSMCALQKAYADFMAWDLSIAPGLKGVEHAFYFTMRDSYMNGNAEHFGLIDKCNSTECKLAEQFPEPDGLDALDSSLSLQSSASSSSLQ